jgi:hypothetical protein
MRMNMDVAAMTMEGCLRHGGSIIAGDAEPLLSMQSSTVGGSRPRSPACVKQERRLPSRGADWSPEYACGGSERRIGPPIRFFGDARIQGAAFRPKRYF